MTDTSDSNYWGDWDSTKRQDLEAKGVVFNEQGVPLSGLNQAMAEIDPDWAPTGTGSFLASVNPTYATQQSIYESDDYKRFIDQMKTYNPEALEAYGGPELWAMNQRALEAGTSLFAADTIAGATGADTFKTDSTTTTSSNSNRTNMTCVAACTTWIPKRTTPPQYRLPAPVFSFKLVKHPPTDFCGANKHIFFRFGCECCSWNLVH